MSSIVYVYSDVIEELLMNSMTPKGVIKLGTLVEASYTSIQQLLLVHFQLASDALYYHLVEIKVHVSIIATVFFGSEEKLRHVLMLEKN